MDLAGKKIVITGGASLIGSHIADQLLDAGVGQVVLIDNFSFGAPATIRHLDNHPSVELVKGDICELEDLQRLFSQADGVFALAGFLTLPMSKNPALGLSVNVLGMVNTLEACVHANVKRVVFSSSVSTYGNSSGGVITEETPYMAYGLPAASQIYGSSKLIGEALCAHYAGQFGLAYNVLRFSSVYGERQHARAVNAVFIANVIRQVLNGEAPSISGDGSEVHDYLYVTDAARAAVLAMCSDSHNNVLNICTAQDTSLTEVANIALEEAGRADLAPQYQKDTRSVRSSAVSSLNFSHDKATQLIGWEPTISLRQGIKRYMGWLQQQEESK